MYHRLTVKWSNTLFGCLAVLLAPVPIVLFVWGPQVRSRSKYAKLIEAWQERQLETQSGKKLDISDDTEVFQSDFEANYNGVPEPKKENWNNMAVDADKIGV